MKVIEGGSMRKMLMMFGVLLVALGVNAKPQPLYFGDDRVDSVTIGLDVHDNYSTKIGIQVVNSKGKGIWLPFLVYISSLREFDVSDAVVLNFYKEHVSEIKLGPAPEFPDLRIAWKDFLDYRKDLLKAQKGKQDLQQAEDKRQSAEFQRLKTIFGWSLCTTVKQGATNDAFRCVNPNQGSTEYEFTPKKQFMSFNRYGCHITPQSRKIHTIYATSAKLSSAEIDLVVGAFEQKFGIKLNRGGSLSAGYVARNDKGNERMLSVETEGNVTKICLTDKYGLEQAAKEAGNAYDKAKQKVISNEIDAL